MDIPKILESTKPVLYETGYDEWPYSYAGSCFPVRWGSNLYIASAFHCYDNHKVNPEDTLYPIPIESDNFFGFCCILRARANDANDLKHYDQILLQVSSEINSDDQLKSVFAIDLSSAESIIDLSSKEVTDVWLRGYLSENPSHEISYDERKIKQQAFVTNGIVSSRKSSSDYCHMLKVKTPTPGGYSPDGMSGSPVYATDKQGNTRLAGVVIEFNIYTEEYLVIGSEVLRELLRRENA
jgi:hypothetical protein